MEPTLRLRNITKKYGRHIALQNVDLDLYPGEIHGLVGENGAGKSTLLGILAGQPEISRSGGFSGSVCWQGCPVTFSSPAAAARLGIGMVNQDFALLPTLTIAENIRAGRESILPWSRRLGQWLACIDTRQDLKLSAAVLSRLQVRADPAWITGRLPVSLRQFVELAREISKSQLQLLILDEPTAALTPSDATHLLSVLAEIAADGVAVLLVSHRLEEITACCRRVTVLRNGRTVARYAHGELNLRQIAASMLGRLTVESRRRPSRASAETLLDVSNFSVNMSGDTLHNLTFRLQRGEILGITSLPGHGRSAVGNGMLGLFPSSGELKFDGATLTPWSNGAPNTAAMLAAGICLVPDDRRQSGLLLQRSIEENITFAAVQQGKFLQPRLPKWLGWLSHRQTAACATAFVRQLDIRCRDIHQPVRELSGGNQQKVCLAQALALGPRVLFLHEPTRGVDIGAKEMLLQALLNLNEDQGITLVVASGELAELKRICDRILVLYEGRISAILPPDCPEPQLALALAGKGESF
ncbi:MAG TPA: sugar ABC transporter ATP-binding protein [Patescibacteria group bacterium]|nr:sugar ABC transporter ATP-binding protein [Patescibacteria group bacterium]